MPLALALLGVLAATVVAGASSADFDGDNGPCRETPGNTALLRCPTAYVGLPYQVQITTEEDSGCTPYVWFEIVNSTLPAGLSMSRSGLISGVPAGGVGLGRFWIWLHDLTAAQGGPSWCAFDDRSEREFSIPVQAGLAITTTSVKPGTVGQPYSATLAAKQVLSLNPLTGPDVQATWSLQSGALPAGVTLSPQGALAGTPSAEGGFQFVVRAQAGDISATQAYALAVRQPVVVNSPVAGARPPKAEVGIAFKAAATATGGTGAYAWSLASGALPSGLVLDPATGAIAGTPRTAGAFAVVLAATDAEGRSGTASISLNVAAKLAIKAQRLRTATRGRVYRAKLATAGGVQPVRWKVLQGRLPVGMRFARDTGTLAGTPRQIGRFRITVEARDQLGGSARASVGLVVRR